MSAVTSVVVSGSLRSRVSVCEVTASPLRDLL